jgi:hypothetical protein
MTTRRLSIATLMFLACPAVVQRTAAQVVPVTPLVPAIESDSVAVSGITPRGKAIFLGVTREVGDDDYPTVRMYQEEVEDRDGDGAVRLDLERPLPKRTLFVVIDATTGEAKAVTSAEFGLRLRDWRGGGPGLTGNGLARLAERSALAQVVLVRPGG